MKAHNNRIEQLPQMHEVKLTYARKTKAADRPKITCSTDAADYLANVWDDDTINLYECFYCLYLNRANRVIGWNRISQGGVSGTVADSKLIFATALKLVASGIILAHNHPSGNLQPSNADISLTKRLKEGAKLLEMNILDHIILTETSYTSLADQGLM